MNYLNMNLSIMLTVILTLSVYIVKVALVDLNHVQFSSTIPQLQVTMSDICVVITANAKKRNRKVSNAVQVNCNTHVYGKIN